MRDSLRVYGIVDAQGHCEIVGKLETVLAAVCVILPAVYKAESW